MAKVTVLSTLTNNFTFVLYEIPANPTLLPIAKRRIRIFGGANRASMNGVGDMTTDNNGVPLWTRAGVATQVDEADIKWLAEDPSFKAFVAGGNLRVLDTDREMDNKRIKSIVAADMAPSDSHAPMTKGDNRVGKMKIIMPTDNAENDNNRI